MPHPADGCTPAQRAALDALQAGEVRAYLVVHQDGWVSPPRSFADAAARDLYAVQQRAVLVPLVVAEKTTPALGRG